MKEENAAAAKPCEFNLSEKIEEIVKISRNSDIRPYNYMIDVKDVKEFMRLLKEGYEECFNKNLLMNDGVPASHNASIIIQNFVDFKDFIDKLIGEKLI